MQAFVEQKDEIFSLGSLFLSPRPVVDSLSPITARRRWCLPRPQTYGIMEPGQGRHIFSAGEISVGEINAGEINADVISTGEINVSVINVSAIKTGIISAAAVNAEIPNK